MYSRTYCSRVLQLQLVRTVLRALFASVVRVNPLDLVCVWIETAFRCICRQGTAEIDVMVAEHRHRRRGFASEAVRLLMETVRVQLGVRVVRAKVKLDNEPSLKLFAGLGFREEARVEVFNEVHLVRELTE